MTRLPLSKAKAELTEIVNRAAKSKERTVLSRGGKRVAAVIPIEDLRVLEEIDRRDIADARKALAEGGKRVPLRDFVRELGD